MTTITEKLAGIRAFLLGMIEFRSDVTSDVDPDLWETYDTGRDIAHRLTFRYWDNCA